MQPRLFEPVPEGCERFDEIVRIGIPEWNPDKNTWERIIALQREGGLNLEHQALDMVIWFKAHRKRKGTNTFVTNWLRKAIEFGKERDHGRASKDREAGSYLKRLTDDDLRARGNIVYSDDSDE